MLRNTRNEPSSGWVFPVKLSDGKEVHVWGGTYNNLKDNLRSFCEVNHLSAPSDEEIQTYLCTINPSIFCKTGGVQWHLTVTKLASFVRAMWASTMGRTDVYVDQEKAEQRALVCVGGEPDGRGGFVKCRHNVSDQGCWSCVLRDVMAESLAPSKKTKVDEHLKACQICGCVLTKLVHYKDEYLPKSEEYPEWCWRRR